MQKMLYGTMGILDQMEIRTDQTIRRLDSFGERVQVIQRLSLEGTVQENRRPSQSGRIQENYIPSRSGRIQENHMPPRSGRAQENRESSQNRRNQEMRKPSVRGSLKAIQSEKNREAGRKIHRRTKLAVR